MLPFLSPEGILGAARLFAAVPSRENKRAGYFLAG